MAPRLAIVSALALAAGAAGQSSPVCLKNAGPSAAGCDCSGVGGVATCALNHCVCTGCAGSDSRCYDSRENTPVGGAGKVYRIRNARWTNWYLESESSAANLWVGKGKDRAAGRTYQWTLRALPADTVSTSYLMMTEFRRDNALNMGTRRVCSVVVNGTELEMDDNTSQATDALEHDGPGPDGFPVEGQGMNGEDLALEPIEENETAKQLELAGRSQDDPDGDWFEDDEELQDVQQMVRREELSYRSRSASYYSRSRSSSYYSRSRYTSYYSRSRTYYSSSSRSRSRSRSYSSYSNYGYSAYGGYNDYAYGYYAHATPRRRTYCRDVLVGNAVSVTGNLVHSKTTMRLTKAPVTSKNQAAPLFMISASAYPDNYLFIPKFSSTADINKGDPGAGGYWFFDPPLPGGEVDKIPVYSGAKCKWYCGSPGKIKDLGMTFVNKAFTQSVSLLLLAVGVGAGLSAV